MGRDGLKIIIIGYHLIFLLFKSLHVIQNIHIKKLVHQVLHLYIVFKFSYKHIIYNKIKFITICLLTYYL